MLIFRACHGVVPSRTMPPELEVSVHKAFLAATIAAVGKKEPESKKRFFSCVSFCPSNSFSLATAWLESPRIVANTIKEKSIIVKSTLIYKTETRKSIAIGT